MIEIRKLKETDIPQALRLIDHSLGEGYYNTEQLQSYIANEKFSYVALEHDTIIGVILNDILSLQVFSESLSVKTSTLSRTTHPHTKIGLLNVLVVKESFQRKGIGKMLLEVSLQEMKERHVHHMFAEAWKTTSGVVNIKKLLVSLGFTEIIEIQDFWKEDSIKEGFSCSFCGFPCICSAVIFRKELT